MKIVQANNCYANISGEKIYEAIFSVVFSFSKHQQSFLTKSILHNERKPPLHNWANQIRDRYLKNDKKETR